MDRNFSLRLSPEEVMAKKNELEKKITAKEQSIKSSIDAEKIKEIELFYKNDFEGITLDEVNSFIDSTEKKYMKKFIEAQLEDQELNSLKDELRELQPQITKAAHDTVGAELRRMFRLAALHPNNRRIASRRI